MLKRYRWLIGIGVLVAVLAAAFSVIPSARASGMEQTGHGGHDFHGDELAYTLLVKVTANTTKQSETAINTQLASGKTIGQIAGTQRNEVLARYDRLVVQAFDRRAQNGKLPQSVADSRKTWYQRDARMMIDQPGLSPRFPGLHEVHAVVVAATIKATNTKRADVKAALEKCGTVSDIAASKGKTAADVINLARSNFEQMLGEAVTHNMLTTAQRDLWLAALSDSINKMVTTPGLHFAGKECAP